MNVLELINVTKDFFLLKNKIEVIKDANLQIKEGEMLALTGPSGSGKTTLLQIAGLLDNPTSGKIMINGIDASKADDEARTKIRKNHIGFIYQFHHLMPEFSALENVAMPLLIKGIKKSEAFLKAQQILQEVSLENRLHHKPSELSGGQQQRVAIARAVVSRPSLILADEPTGNLDSEMSLQIFELLKHLVLSHNIACLMVTHNLELAKKTNKVISIRDGIVTS